MSEERLWRTLHRVVVVDGARAGGTRVLVVAREGGWEVPEWEVEEERAHDPDLGRVVRLVRERLRMEGGVLRYVEPQEDETARRRSGTWVMERRGGVVEAPEGARWATRAELVALMAERGSAAVVGEGTPGVRIALEVLRDSEEGLSPAGRRAWSEPGWLAVAEEWMTAQLDGLGRPPVGPIEQLKNNSISSVLRAHTAAGDFYLKAASPHFRHEAR